MNFLDRFLLRFPKFLMNLILGINFMWYFFESNVMIFSIFLTLYFSVYFLKMDLEKDLQVLKDEYKLKNLSFLTKKEINNDIKESKLLELIKND